MLGNTVQRPIGGIFQEEEEKKAHFEQEGSSPNGNDCVTGTTDNSTQGKDCP